MVGRIAFEDRSQERRERRRTCKGLGTGSFLAIGEAVHPIPWKTMTLQPVERVVVINVEQDKVRNRPLLAEQHQAETVIRQWLAAIYRYDGARPYWREER
jgi:hypothetical protein